MSVQQNLTSLVQSAAAGDEDAFATVMRRMTPLIRAQVHQFQHNGMDEDDLRQECLVGLLSAVRHFRPNAGTLFTTYATTCIHNRLISLARRNGQRVQREEPLEDDSAVPDTEARSPEARLLEQEELTQLQQQLAQRLTPIEYQVLMARLSDRTYEQIAAQLGITKKAVDNAVQRLRRKLI